MRPSLLGGVAAAIAQLAGSPGAANPPPDSHDLPPPRGDRVEEREAAIERPGPYVPPGPGWRYRPLAVGARLAPPFYAPRYVVGDPARHGLARAQGDLRWIRYGDDILLVNVVDGRVARVVRNGYRPLRTDCPN